MYFLCLISLGIHDGLKLNKSSLDILLEVDELFEMHHNPVCIEFIMFL